MNGHCVEIWNNCLKLISENISPQSYKTWFEPIKPLAFEDDMLTIQVPSQFFHEYLEELFGRNVDLVSLEYIDRHLKPYIQADALLYGAGTAEV